MSDPIRQLDPFELRRHPQIDCDRVGRSASTKGRSGDGSGMMVLWWGKD